MQEANIEVPPQVVEVKAARKQWAKTGNLIGTQFGRLTVTGFSHKSSWTTMWFCKCNCGNPANLCIAGANLLRLKRPTLSCGCIGKERAKAVNQIRLKTHGKRFTRTYRCWANMKTRATNQNSGCADRYMLRGIAICDRWLVFENFLADMGECPSGRHSIERNNNDGNYEPLNCRWATNIEQQRNKRNNKLVTFGGETMCLTAMCEKHGLNPVVIQARITQLGWSDDLAFSTPIK